MKTINEEMLTEFLTEYVCHETQVTFDCAEKQYINGIQKVADVADAVGRAHAALDIAEFFGIREIVDFKVFTRMKARGIDLRK